MKKIILALLIALSTVSGALFMKASTPDQAIINSVGAVNFVGVLPTTLSGSGVNATVSSVGVTSMKISQTSQPLSMADFGSIGYATIEPGVPARQEFISFTGITQNANGTAILTGVVRGLAPVSPYTASSTMRFPHGGATKIIISNSPPFYNNFALQTNDATITGVYTYASTSLPRVSIDTTDAQVSAATSSFATINLLNSLSIAGAPNGSEIVKGIWEGATALESASSTVLGATGAGLVIQSRYATDTPLSGCAVGYTSTAGAGCSVIATLAGKIKQTFLDIFTTVNTWTGTNTFTATTTFSAPTFGANVFVQYLASTTINGATAPVAVFVATSTNALWGTNAAIATTSDFLGFAIENRVNGGTTTVQIDGVVSGFTGLTPGYSYYASTTGLLSTVYNAGTAEIYVGRAVSATQLLLDRKDGQMQYLGSVSGTTVEFPLFARFAITNPTLTFSNCGGGFSGTYAAQLIVAKIGVKSASAYGASSCSGGSTPSNASVTASVSGTTLTITSSTNGTATLGNTAYFYR